MLSGDDAITLPLMALGGRGVISVVVERNSGGDDAASCSSALGERFRRRRAKFTSGIAD